MRRRSQHCCPTPSPSPGPPSRAPQLLGDSTGTPPAVASLLALSALLLAGVLDWHADCVRGAPQAWDTLVWFSGAGVWGRTLCMKRGPQRKTRPHTDMR